MADLGKSMTRCAAAAACLLVMLSARAGAQPSQSDAVTKPEFLSRYGFHLAGTKLIIDDRRFSWNAHFGGDFDALDYVVGRVNLLADYEVVLGTEYRAFDPNQGNYTLEASSSLRAAGLEFAAVFHHLSRHLSDRAKRESVDFNVVQGRLLAHRSGSDWRIDAVGTIGPVVKNHFVDYTWVGQGDLRMQRSLSPHVGLFARGVLQLYGVDPEVAGRDTQRGGRVEGGVHLAGRSGAFEMFVGFEQRVDAYQLDRVPQRWMLAGFRIVGGRDTGAW